MPARRAAAAALALLTAASLAACAPTEAEPRDTLVYASGDAEPDCLDPHVGGNYPQALIATQYLESLVSRDSEGRIIPWLATDWSVSDDGLAWEFTLRGDVSFTDGTPLTSEAVAANIAHLQDPDTASSTGYLAVERVESVEQVSDRVARVHLSEPDSALLESLTMPWTAIQSPTALERSQEENCAAPVGTGPFVVEDWQRQDRVVLTRNDDYSSPPADADHEGPAPLRRLEWRFIPDSATRFAALQSGEVDVIDNAQPDRIAAAADDDSIEHLAAPRPGASNRLELNAGQAPFDDERVRRAFIAAVDVDAAIESLFFGTAERSYSALSSVEPAVEPHPEAFEHDPAAANALLDQAGWTQRDDDGVRMKNGERLTVRLPVSTNQSVPAEQSLFEQLQAGAAEVGFDVDISLLDLPSWYAALGANEYELVSAPYTKVGADVLRILYASDGIEPAPSGYFANHAQVALPELDALLEGASATSDEVKREEAYAEAQRILAEGAYVLPLYDQQNHYLYSTDVEGLRAMPTVSTPTFLDVTVGGPIEG